jgi:hypothetical protein
MKSDYQVIQDMVDYISKTRYYSVYMNCVDKFYTLKVGSTSPLSYIKITRIKYNEFGPVEFLYKAGPNKTKCLSYPCDLFLAALNQGLHKEIPEDQYLLMHIE